MSDAISSNHCANGDSLLPRKTCMPNEEHVPGEVSHWQPQGQMAWVWGLISCKAVPTRAEVPVLVVLRQRACSKDPATLPSKQERGKGKRRGLLSPSALWLR